MKCEEVKYYLKDYAEGHLIEEIREEMKAHLIICYECSKINEETIAKLEERGELVREWERKNEFWEHRDMRRSERLSDFPLNGIRDYRDSLEWRLYQKNQQESQKLLTVLFGAMMLVVLAISVLTIIMYTFD
jgi:hypothetical protein